MIEADPVEAADPSGLRLLYLTTHYPSFSHTFIADEVAHLRRMGATIATAAVNAPDDGSLLTDADRVAARETFHIKRHGMRRAIAALASAFVRRPVGLVRCAGRLLRIDAGDLPGLRKRAAQFVEGAIVWRHCRSLGITAIHAHFGHVPASIAWYAAEIGRSVAPDEQWTWSMTVHGWHEFTSERRNLLAEKVRAAAVVVCISDFTRSQMMRIADPTDWDRLVVVRCGIDVRNFPSRPAGLTSDEPSIVMTARLSPEKGHLVLLDALVRLREMQRPVRARLIGGGPFEPSIRDAIAERNLDETVEMLGPQPPAVVESALSTATIFCLPSFAEGLPVSIMEAMAVGVPVVTTAISGIPELVIDGVTGRCLPAGRADLLAAAIAGILDDPEAAARQVTTGRDAVLAAHDGPSNAAQLASQFARVHPRR